MTLDEQIYVESKYQARILTDLLLISTGLSFEELVDHIGERLREAEERAERAVSARFSGRCGGSE